MRKRTKNLWLGLSIGLVLAVLATCGTYYYGVIQMKSMKHQYEALLDDIRHPPSVEAWVLKQDLQQGMVITEDLLDQVSLPQTFASKGLLVTKDEALGNSARVTMHKGQVLYHSSVYVPEEVPADLRRFELTSLVLPYDVNEEDVIDVRISFPSGLDYVVLSKKQIKEIIQIGSDQHREEVLVVYLNTDELLRLSSAFVDAYLRLGTYLYPTVYVAPDVQEAANVTYPANEDVQILMQEDPNIVQKAMVYLEQQKRADLSASLARLPQNVTRAVPERNVLKAEEADVDEEVLVTDELSAID